MLDFALILKVVGQEQDKKIKKQQYIKKEKKVNKRDVIQNQKQQNWLSFKDGLGKPKKKAKIQDPDEGNLF
jgi:hypothetical protein